MAKKNEELAVAKNAFTQLADMDMAQMMAEELDGLDLNFERIKIPSAGSTIFEIPSDEDTEAVKEFSAVILYHHPLRAYYMEKYSGGNAPPDCGSFDNVTGEGDPGGECKNCPYNRFGSGENGGKACKDRRRIFLIREGEIFPLLLSLPTGSLREFTKYVKRLLAKGLRSNSVITRFSLKKAVNAGGIAFSQANFAVDRPLTPDEHSQIERLSAQVKTYSKNLAIEYDTPSDQEDVEPVCIDPETGEVLRPLT